MKEINVSAEVSSSILSMLRKSRLIFLSFLRGHFAQKYLESYSDKDSS